MKVVKFASSASGTSAMMVCRPSSSGSMPSTRPRRLVTSPMMSPVLSLGTWAFRVWMGSRMTGPASGMAAL